MKKLSIFALVCIMCQAAFSYSGLMSGQEFRLRIAKTKYFDIIYTPESEHSANIIFEKADGLYDELREKYIVPHDFRTTVSICHTNTRFNASYSPFPYNTIVLYDTVPEDSMMVFSEVLLNTFRHELIHAMTYNSKNTFWRMVGRIFGDVVNPSLLTATLAMAEGATVSSESDFGEGRLNSDIHTAVIRQAKIEGKFPKYSEINGARDTSPGANLSYYFGGAFSEYLQKKYGMQKFAQLWYNAVNVNRPSYWFYFTNFKKVYGIKIKDAWKDFYDSIEVPDVKDYPWKEDWCSFPEAAIPANRTRNLYTSVSSGSSGFAYYDAASSKVVFTDTNGKSRTVLKEKAVSRLSLSPDGKFLAVFGYRSNLDVEKSFVTVVNTQNFSSYTIREKGVRDGTVFYSGGNWYLAAIKTLSQNCHVKTYRLDLSTKEKITNARAVGQFDFPFGDIPFSPAGTMDGKFFFVNKTGMDFSMCAYDAEKNELLQFDILEGAGDAVEKPVLLQLDASVPGSVSFTYTRGGSMARLGIFEYSSDFSSASFRLSKNDSSGGIYSPSLYDGGKKVLFIGKFFEDRKILCADVQKMEFEKLDVQVRAFDSAKKSENFSGKDVKVDSLKSMIEENIAEKSSENSYGGELAIQGESRRFSSLAYTFTGQKGVFLPFGMSQVAGFTANPNGSVSLSAYRQSFGLSYASASPWRSPIWIASFSFDPFFVNFIPSLQVTGTAGNLEYEFLGNVEIGRDGFKQTLDGMSLKYVVPFGLSYVYFSSDTTFFYGREDDLLYLIGLASPDRMMDPVYRLILDPDSVSLANTKKYLYADETAKFAVGNIRQSSSDVNSFSGCQLSSVFTTAFVSKSDDGVNTFSGYRNLGLDFQVRIPRLLPFEMYSTTLNLPLSLGLSLIPSVNYYASARAGAVLFSTEIQRSTNFLPLLYFNRFTLEAAYTGNFTDDITEPLPVMAIANTGTYMGNLFSGASKYYDELEIKASLFATPNIGHLASSSFKFSIDASLLCRFSPIPAQSNIGAKIMGAVLF